MSLWHLHDAAPQWWHERGCEWTDIKSQTTETLESWYSQLSSWFARSQNAGSNLSRIIREEEAAGTPREELEESRNEMDHHRDQAGEILDELGFVQDLLDARQ